MSILKILANEQAVSSMALISFILACYVGGGRRRDSGEALTPVLLLDGYKKLFLLSLSPSSSSPSFTRTLYHS
jgi:hypothetical protein